MLRTVEEAAEANLVQSIYGYMRNLARIYNRTKRIRCRRKQERKMLDVTSVFTCHPEGWNYPCACDHCVSYVDF